MGGWVSQPCMYKRAVCSDLTRQQADETSEAKCDVVN